MITHLTVEEVRARIEDIKAVVADAERAHSLEDSLYEDILRAIATDRCDDPKGCAAAALSTQDIDFPRWCA